MLPLLCICITLGVTACSDPSTGQTSLSTDRLTGERVIAAPLNRS